MLLYAVRLQYPSQTVDLFGIQKMSCWQCCCSCLQHGGIEAKALVDEHLRFAALSEACNSFFLRCTGEHLN